MLPEGVNMRINNKLRTSMNTSIKLCNKIKVRSFFHKLLLSYYLVITICICSMGIISYNIVRSSIKEQSIKSNDKLLHQFKNTVDSLILENINDFSLKVLQDTNINPDISYFFSSSMETNIYGMVSVLEYCDKLKTLNPMLYYVGIYFEKNQLLISNEGVRSTKYGDMPNQKDFVYYYNLIKKSSSNPSWHVNNSFDTEYIRYYGSPRNIIHLVRKVPVISEFTNLGGAIIISIDEKVFYKLVKKTAAQNLDKIIICDSEGSVISHTDNELLGQNITDFAYGDRIIKTAEPTGSFIVNINGTPSVVSFCTSEYNDWKYINVTPMEKYNAAASFLIRIMLFISLATITVGLFISLIPALKLSNPMKRLVGFCIGLNKNLRSNRESEYNIIQSTIEGLSFNVKEQEQKFTDVLPVLKENFLQHIISDDYKDTNQTKIRMNMLDLSFPHKYFCTLTFSNAITDVIMYEYAKISISDTLKKIFDSHASKYFHCEKNGNKAIIINFDMDEERIHELLYSFENSKDNEITKGLFFSMGPIVEDITQIGKSYATANIGLKYRYIFPDKKLILPGDIIRHETSNAIPDKKLVGNLAASLHKQDLNSAINDINSLVSIFRTEAYHLEHIEESLSLCVAAVDEFASAAGIQANNIYSDGLSINQHFKKFDNILDFQEWMTGLIALIFEQISRLHSENNREIIQKAIDQIKNDICNPNLSLKTVAKALYVSQSHLSRIFKNETGVTFIDYVTNLKLEYCKDLLLHTTIKIDEIALMMGYSTSHYFISRFKIKYGCTPKKFRYKHSGNNIPNEELIIDE